MSRPPVNVGDRARITAGRYAGRSGLVLAIAWPPARVLVQLDGRAVTLDGSAVVPLIRHGGHSPAPGESPR